MQTFWFRTIPNNQQRITLLSQTLQAIWVASKVCITFWDTFNSFILWQSRPKMGGGMPTYNHHISISKRKILSFRHSHDSLTTAMIYTNDHLSLYTWKTNNELWCKWRNVDGRQTVPGKQLCYAYFYTDCVWRKCNINFTNLQINKACPFDRIGICKWHSFPNVTKVCFEITISNFICTFHMSWSKV